VITILQGKDMAAMDSNGKLTWSYFFNNLIIIIMIIIIIIIIIIVINNK